MNKTLKELLLEAEQINDSQIARAVHLPPINVCIFVADKDGEFTTSAIGNLVRNLYGVEQQLLRHFGDNQEKVDTLLNTPYTEELFIVRGMTYVYTFDLGEIGKFGVKFWIIR